jgi:hypothetical protein
MGHLTDLVHPARGQTVCAGGGGGQNSQGVAACWQTVCANSLTLFTLYKGMWGGGCGRWAGGRVGVGGGESIEGNTCRLDKCGVGCVERVRTPQEGIHDLLGNKSMTQLASLWADGEAAEGLKGIALVHPAALCPDLQQPPPPKGRTHT